MKTVKMVICQTEWACWKTLKVYKKMTPGATGQWKNMITVDNYKDADVAVVVDYTIHDLPKDMPKVYIGAHPYGHIQGYRCYDDKKDAIGKFDLRDTAGFGEWWLDKDYDTLVKLGPPEKTKDLVTIISEKDTTEGHRERRRYIERFCSHHEDKIEVYGRIKPKDHEPNIKKCYKGPLGYHKHDSQFPDLFQKGKDELLRVSKYILEHDDNFGCIHYFSERFFDDLLMWCMPIYYGGGEIDRFLPKNSFRLFDYNTSPNEIMDMVNGNFYEEHLEDIAKARDLLLNTYQLFPRVYEPIAKHFGLEE